jgi:hypothetical protein
MAVLASNGPIDAQQYDAIVERFDELDRLRAQIERRKSMLIFGPEAVGKTRLLHSFAQTHPLALFVARVESPRELLLAVIEELRQIAKTGITLPADCTSMGPGLLRVLCSGRSNNIRSFSLSTISQDHPVS